MTRDVIAIRGGNVRFRVDIDARQLLDASGAVVPLTPRQFDLLVLLARNPRKAFLKDDLIKLLWGEHHASGDDPLFQLVKGLRASLGDDAADPKFITTLPQKGYRFDVEVESGLTPPTPVRSESAAAPRSTSRYDEWRKNAATIFAPGPVSDEPRLVGREFELQTARRHLMIPGQHVMFYGPVGAGKSSIANVLAIILARSASIVWCPAEVNQDDTFEDMTRKIRAAIYRRLGDERRVDSRVTPSELATELDDIATKTPFVMILDEFQRDMAHNAAVGVAELLRSLSNRQSRAQFILAGAADNIQELAAGHESLVLRYLLPIPVGTMTRPTTLEIIRRGFSDMATTGWPDLGSSMRLDVISEGIAALSLGLPSIITGLARETAYAALDNLSVRIIEADFENGLRRLTAEYARSLTVDLRQLARDKYLLACAASRIDSFGYHTVEGAASTFVKLCGEPITDADMAARLAVHVRSKLLTSGPHGGYRFALSLIPPRLVVTAVAERTLKIEQLTNLWRHSPDQILDELEYQLSECVRLADAGQEGQGRDLYQRFCRGLAFALEQVVSQSSYPSQRERLEVMRAKLPGLQRMIGLGDEPTVS